jgi:hypothetical protein
MGSPGENMPHTIDSCEVEHIAGSQTASGSYNLPYAMCMTSQQAGIFSVAAIEHGHQGAAWLDYLISI